MKYCSLQKKVIESNAHKQRELQDDEAFLDE